MKKRELIELNVIFNQLKDFGGTKFKYGIIRNINLLKPHLSALEEIETSIKEVMKDFETDRNNLIIELGVHNPDGSVFIDQKDSEAMAKFNESLQGLIEKHKEAIDIYNEKLKEFDDILNEDVEETIAFRYIDVDQCPEDGITSLQLDVLIKLDIIK